MKVGFYADKEEAIIIRMLTEEQLYFLQDTRNILVDYDGYRNIEDLKKLIDETRDRLSELISQIKSN